MRTAGSITGAYARQITPPNALVEGAERMLVNIDVERVRGKVKLYR